MACGTPLGASSAESGNAALPLWANLRLQPVAETARQPGHLAASRSCKGQSTPTNDGGNVEIAELSAVLDIDERACGTRPKGQRPRFLLLKPGYKDQRETPQYSVLGIVREQKGADARRKEEACATTERISLACKAHRGILRNEYREQRASVGRVGRNSTSEVRVDTLYCKIELENKKNNMSVVYNNGPHGERTGSQSGAGAQQSAVDWLVSEAAVSYPEAIARMEERVDSIRAQASNELVWLLEHPPIYTAGTSAKEADLLDARFPVFRSGRGGQLTYHGPGQRIGYVMLDLRRRRKDVRSFVNQLEEWLIAVLSNFGIEGRRRPGYVGIWVASGDNMDKIAAVGVRVRHWVTFHGVSLNVAPELGHYSGIIPCGVRDGGVTSLAKLGLHPSMKDVDHAMQCAFASTFGQMDGRR